MSTLLALLNLAGSPSGTADARPAWAADPTPELAGPLDANTISDALLRAKFQVDTCRQALVAQRPGPVNTVARFTVQPNGRATDLTVATEGGVDAWFGGCLVGALQPIRFPTADAPTTVTWTLGFPIANTGAAPGMVADPSSSASPGNGLLPQTNGETVVLGALDKDLIDAGVRRRMSQIRYCYQRELTKNPALAGKVVFKFVIAADGRVTTASTKSTTLNNPAAEQCMEKEFMQMNFPEPRGGGIVIVSYPFIFAPG